MPRPKTRRYSIEIKDPDNKLVLFTAVDWTEAERLIAVAAQIMRLAGLPDDKWSPGNEPGREVAEPPWRVINRVYARATVVTSQSLHVTPRPCRLPGGEAALLPKLALVA